MLECDDYDDDDGLYCFFFVCFCNGKTTCVENEYDVDEMMKWDEGRVGGGGGEKKICSVQCI